MGLLVWFTDFALEDLARLNIAGEPLPSIDSRHTSVWP